MESLQYGIGGKSPVELDRIREGLSLVVACPDRDVVAVKAIFSQLAGKEDAISVVTLSFGGVADDRAIHGCECKGVGNI
ncbi:MAG: hypothetical protein CBC31_009140 [Verrucomicrobia bacterium TMED71]|nr:MAG: hypothetical protein CBC31_009140 [Verrucomicrobia bacterium TMED71]